MKFETMLNKSFRCIGENFKDGVKMGCCGDIHTLDEWLKILFPDKYDFAKDYFKGDTLPQILDYILINKGKRLIKERRC